ncbi:MAG: glycosyltransferase family 39 protein [Phycisphaerae bacterium]|nr:glycosyltransferase family 39 protein [Phycisphaerae bacterium]
MNRNHWIILILITALGLGLRLTGLGHESLYNDELHTWQQTHYDTLALVMTKGMFRDVYPPAYPALIYFWQKAFGDSEAMLRLPSALAGTLWIPVICLLGRKLFGPPEGLIAAALVAVAWTPIYFSQEVRAYSIFVLLVMLMAYYWASVVRDRKAWASVGYVLCATAALYVHPMSVVVVGLAGLAMAVVVAANRSRAMPMTFAAIHLVIAVLYLPWLAEFVRDARGALFFLPKPGPRHLARAFAYWFNQSSLIVAIAVGLYLCLAYRFLRRGISREELMLILWAVVPVLLVFIKSIVSGPIFTNRNLLICLPAAYLLLARSITVTFARPVLRAGLSTALAGVFLLHLVVGMRYYTAPHKAQFREAVAYVVSHEHEFPNAVTVGWAWKKEHFDYYFERLASKQRLSILAGMIQRLPDVDTFLAERRPRYVWLVYAHLVPNEQVLAFFKDRYRLVDEAHFIFSGAYLFEAPSTASAPAPGASRPSTPRNPDE